LLPFLSVCDLLRSRASTQRARELLRFEGRGATIAEVDETSSRLAAVLRTSGVRHGDRVAIQMPNGIEFPVAWLAVAKTGAVVVPVSTKFRDHDLLHMWRATNCTADDVGLTAQPFYYMDPVWNLVLCLLAGAPLVILPRFSASTFWRSVQVARVVPPDRLIDEALAFAALVAQAAASQSIGLLKQALRQTHEVDLEGMLALEADGAERCLHSADARERLKRFVESR
jgi:acyl-CoA synthetase (AMP-forming)/AMP-acid ligase II